MSNILITGSEGSLMQAVIPFLLDKGHTVYGIDNFSKAKTKHTGITHANYHLIEGDLLEPDTLKRVEDKNVAIDYIIQGAAQIYGVGGFNKFCANILDQDTRIQSAMLNFAVKHKIKRFVYISSSMVYESCPQLSGYDNTPCSEMAPDFYPAPKTEYGLSKYVGEKMVEAYRKQHGLSYIIWRPFNIITPYEKAYGEDIGISHVFADFIKNILIEKDQILEVLGDGQQIRCFTWIDDVASAIANYSFGEKENDAWNIGNNEPITMLNLALEIHKHGKKAGLNVPAHLQFKHKTAYPNDVRVRIPSIEKIKKDFGFEPTVKLDESIERCCTFAIRNTLTW